MENQDNIHDLQMDFIDSRKKYIRAITKREQQNSKIELELLKITKYELDRSKSEKFECNVTLDESLLNEIKPDTTDDARLLELKKKANMLMKAAKYKSRSQQSKTYINMQE